MEVLASGLQCVRDSECPQPQQSFRMDLNCDGESNGIRHEGQAHVAHDSMDELVITAEGFAVGNHSEVLGATEKLHIGGASNFDSHDFRDENANRQNDCKEPCFMSENSHIFVDIIESESPDRKRGELSHSETRWLDGNDVSMAVWVKVISQKYFLYTIARIPVKVLVFLYRNHNLATTYSDFYISAYASGEVCGRQESNVPGQTGHCHL